MKILGLEQIEFEMNIQVHYLYSVSLKKTHDYLAYDLVPRFYGLERLGVKEYMILNKKKRKNLSLRFFLVKF